MRFLLRFCADASTRETILDVVFGSPAIDAEIGTLDHEDQTLDLERNRNLKIPARAQDEQSVFKNQGRP
jgi:hypothetical protein